MDSESVGSVIYRPAESEDLAFILDSWGSSFYKGCKAHRLLCPDEFHAFHRETRKRFFSKPNTCVIVACNPDFKWQILGWIAVEQITSALILHYIYVKSAYKGGEHGIARGLIKRGLPSGTVLYTHLTDKAVKILSKKSADFLHFKYLPHLI